MTRTPRPEAVDLEGDYYRVRFRDPGEFATIRTPEWARTAARSVAAGTRVRTGRRGDDWVVQSVLVPERAGETRARAAAREIVEMIERE